GIEAAAKSAPWVLRTLVEFTSHSSLRLAAAALFVHHSTLQDRLVTIEHELGWSVRDPQGRLRAQLALAVRRLLLHPAAPHPA
ncbi:helix-turn-helix domain-containing protein, partial [Nocardia vinacea]|uniref:helix-turn-helix domain-containing protein n=1 Tax=Nocardia vinacea TaxID=96468 RepID=UPI000592E5E1